MRPFLALSLALAAAAPAAAAEGRPSKVPEAPLSVGHVHVGVRDSAAALEWLARVLGWKPSYRDESLAIVPAGPIRLMLDAAQADSPATIALVSEDVDADYQRLLERGAVSLEAPEDKTYGARAAYVRGPGALRFELEGPLTGPTTGFIYTEVRAGDGASPRESDTVKVFYTGSLRDGTVFDSRLKGRPEMLPLKSVIPCWTKGITRMKVGGKAKFVCPPSTAYGLKGRPPRIPPGAVLLFDVELVGILAP